MEMLQEYLPVLKEGAMFYGFNLLKAIAIFIVGKWLAKLVKKGVLKAMTKIRNRSHAQQICGEHRLCVIADLRGDCCNQSAWRSNGVTGGCSWCSRFWRLVLALQGSLANFAAGVMAIIFRPYNVGDVVTMADETGQVEELDIFYDDTEAS